MILIVVLINILAFIYGLAKSVKDTISHHYHLSIFRFLDPLFWNPEESWKNKYKIWHDAKPEPKFWGSTTVFVFTTDAWHLFDTIQSISWQLAVAIVLAYSIKCPLYFIPLIIIGLKMSTTMGFTPTYNKLFIKK